MKVQRYLFDILTLKMILYRCHCWKATKQWSNALLNTGLRQEQESILTLTTAGCGANVLFSSTWRVTLSSPFFLTVIAYRVTSPNTTWQMSPPFQRYQTHNTALRYHHPLFYQFLLLFFLGSQRRPCRGANISRCITLLIQRRLGHGGDGESALAPQIAVGHVC